MRGSRSGSAASADRVWGRAAAGLLLASTACFSSRSQPPREVAVVDGDPIVQMVPAEKLPSVDRAALVPPGRHTDPPAPWEPVIGVALDRDHRGYPVGLLDTYEVVNDRASGVAFVVTRCPLAQSEAVYDREVGGRTLTFINSGALWRDTLVMQDRETGTLWTVATGRALYGPLAGESLRPIPVVLATSAAWRKLHPDTRYLDTGDLTETPLRISLYEMSDWQGVSGARAPDRRHEPKAKMFSVADGSEALAFTENDVKDRGCVGTRLGADAVRLEWDVASDAPRAYRASGSRLEEIAVVPMYWFALDRHFETVRTLSDGPTPDP